MSRWSRSVLVPLAMVSLSCKGGAGSPTLSTGGNETSTSDGADAGSGTETGGLCDVCVGNEYDACGGDPMDCGALTCSDGLGCTECRPGTPTCVGNAVHECGDDGTPGAMTGTCDAGAGEVCSSGACQDACTVAGQDPSNVGCTFWAVDLPNERGLNNASEGEWGVVLANAEGDEASVIIERNLAAPGQPLNLAVVATEFVPAGTLKAVSLPTAEVTGTPDPVTGRPPGTWLSSNAFRITSSSPLVAYQFNNFQNDFSNDASLLLPQTGLGRVYRVLGYPVANPIPLPFPGLPWRSHVTIVGVEPDTLVTFRASHLTVSDMVGIPILQPGDEYTTTIGPFDTLVFGSDGIPGDMTGSVVEADRPVAVFSSNEGSSGPSLFGDSEIPNPPGWSSDDTCCTDHAEEQMFPATSLGTNFVIGHSPPRGSSFIEPDELRFLAVAEAATVTTNLAPPWDNFTLQPGEVLDAWTQGETIVESTAPLMISQHLVSQGRTEDFTGDPAMTVFPPIEQWRDHYLFLVPPSWTRNTIVVTAPVGVALDLDTGGLPAGCTTTAAGQVAGVDYEVIRCDVDLGLHTIRSGSVKGEGTPFGLTAYGYAPVGSYAYSAGADVSAIYAPPPIP